MTISQMLGQSALLTLLGMGVVFSFLIIMILCMRLLHAFVRALKLDKEETEKTVPAAASSAAPPRDEPAVAAIAAAVHERQLHT